MKRLNHRLGGAVHKPKMEFLDQEEIEGGFKFKWIDLHCKTQPVKRGFIYKIKNTKTKKFYIGQTGDILTRIRDHIYQRMSSTAKLGNAYDWQIEILKVVKFNEPKIGPAITKALLPIEEVFISLNADNPNMVNLGTNSEWHKNKKRIKGAN